MTVMIQISSQDIEFVTLLMTVTQMRQIDDHAFSGTYNW
jgi:hypothetical protein